MGALLIVVALLAQTAPAAKESGWKNVTAGVGGETWGYAGVTLMSAVPDRDEIIAGVSESGLWSSTDGGATWKKLGASDKEPIKNRPHQIVYDPKNPRVFWISGNYGAGIFRTDDAGASFHRLGQLQHVDGIAVDFSDPARRTLLTGLHEQTRSLHISHDGGAKWEKIGDKFPEDSNFTTDPLILDSKTFLVNTAGWAKGKTSGIYRSSDAGVTWTKVFEGGPGGRGLVTSAGDVFWQAVWGGGLLKGTEKGATWTKSGGPVKTNVIEMPGGKLAGLADQQLFVSANGGTSWDKVGDPLPMKAQGVVFSAKRKAFYVWKMSDKKATDTVWRWDLTE
jgi:photosystem II stability/assembly factor-like uncharacterized protein